VRDSAIQCRAQQAKSRAARDPTETPHPAGYTFPGEGDMAHPQGLLGSTLLYPGGMGRCYTESPWGYKKVVAQRRYVHFPLGPAIFLKLGLCEGLAFPHTCTHSITKVFDHSCTHLYSNSNGAMQYNDQMHTPGGQNWVRLSVPAYQVLL
jgi:hypothetical protein